ncbi:hypothetical protein [Microbacterium sp. CFBP9034]|uniref:hypothetical protein n=1 Tax=Microbacterium sp. CFBP9034 TaxID=3096540 RepID=UPI002A69F812|nr:hypothetical protein [Microbacterium sp. CFBP9034]MDY0908308.1 hypothetical protein [Microbacterium sp. CFBP9034]
MREHIEVLMVGLAASLRRERRRPARTRGPRRARGTFVPVRNNVRTLRLAH